ncbi:variant erythrocyte surface antigen-1 family protein [Babesia caballi]|uniref:Variant erythrocyte surface antigen-1 family protein n=1 Tax=Babesia caballi TaxID=5871 RepID=A0AAV4LRG5_BABCB|nr:variant erythrocyte surface antigen-1 family protein [Babesia caballi]
MGESQKSQLTDWPEDLKDVIDWFLRVGEMDQGGSGQSKSEALKNAIDKLPGFKEATQGPGTFYIDGLFGSVSGALQHFIGYNSGTRELEGKGIGSVSGYTSSYSDQATWNVGWTAGSPEANKAASIFLGSMPILYYFVTYLYWRCKQGSDYGGWRGVTINLQFQQGT